MYAFNQPTGNYPIRPQYNPKSRSSNDTGGLTEILLSNFNDSNLDMVLPMLAHLSRNTAKDKWFTWIAPEPLSKAMLELYGFNLNNIRLIHTRSDEETLWVLWEALSNGKSDTVVATCDSVSKKQFHELNSAAVNGQARGLILTCA